MLRLLWGVSCCLASKKVWLESETWQASDVVGESADRGSVVGDAEILKKEHAYDQILQNRKMDGEVAERNSEFEIRQRTANESTPEPDHAWQTFESKDP
eukprot:2862612-Rhodomonas_salina.1